MTADCENIETLSNSSSLDNSQIQPVLPSAEEEWMRRKERGEENKYLDTLMNYEGLEAVKKFFLNTKSTVDRFRQDGRDLAAHNFSVSLLGDYWTSKPFYSFLFGLLGLVIC
jgi:hypothetical protein